MERWTIDRHWLKAKMRSIARGERPAPAHARHPTFNSLGALMRLHIPENQKPLLRFLTALATTASYCRLNPPTTHRNAIAGLRITHDGH